MALPGSTTAHAIKAEIAVFDPGAGGSRGRRLDTQSPATCDCKLSSRLRGGTRASDDSSTAADRVHYARTWQHTVGVVSTVLGGMLKTIIEKCYVWTHAPCVGPHGGWPLLLARAQACRRLGQMLAKPEASIESQTLSCRSLMEDRSPNRDFRKQAELGVRDRLAGLHPRLQGSSFFSRTIKTTRVSAREFHVKTIT